MSRRVDARAVERWGLLLALVAYVLVQVNAVLHRGYEGQDFLTQHVPLIRLAMRDPWGAVQRLASWHTNPPLFYLLAAQVARWSGGARHLAGLALLDVLANAVGLVLWSRILARLVADPLLRLAGMVLVLFLPFALIQAGVIACDALATAVFFLIAYLCVRLAEAEEPGRAIALACAVGASVLVGLATKLTFVSTAGVLAALLPLMAREKKRWSRRTRLAVLVLAGVLPLAAGLAELGALSAGHPGESLLPSDRHGGRDERAESRRSSAPATGTSWRRPPYDETVRIGSRAPVPASGSWKAPAGTELNLLQADRFSYPALLHLAIFSDVGNFYQDRSQRRYFGRRSAAHQARMTLAVRTGTLFSLAALLAVPFVGFTALRSFVRDRGGALALLPIVLALAFYLNVVAVMPFTSGAYREGYWLPRLVAPSLLVFFSCIFVALDRLPPAAKRWARWLALGLVALQSLVHVSFLWP